MNKNKAQKIHAKRRFLERHGIEFTAKKEQFFVDQIQSGKATFIQKRTNRISIFEVIYDGKPYQVAYDKHRHSIATVLGESLGFMKEVPL